MMAAYRAGDPCMVRQGSFELVCNDCGRSLNILTNVSPGHVLPAEEMIAQDPSTKEGVHFHEGRFHGRGR